MAVAAPGRAPRAIEPNGVSGARNYQPHGRLLSPRLWPISSQEALFGSTKSRKVAPVGAPYTNLIAAIAPRARQPDLASLLPSAPINPLAIQAPSTPPSQRFCAWYLCLAATSPLLLK